MGPGSRVGTTVAAGAALRTTSIGDPLADRLLGERIVVVGQPVDDDVAQDVCGRLVLLAAENRRQDITLYVNSAGGSPGAVTAIHDTMRWVRPDVTTIVHGTAASAALLLAAGGAAGKRIALPHARFQLRHPTGGAGGSASDVRGWAEELARQRRELVELIAARCGRPADDVAAEAEHGRWFTPEEAVAYGLVDRIGSASMDS